MNIGERQYDGKSGRCQRETPVWFGLLRRYHRGRFPRNARDRTDKTIAQARQRLDIARRFGGISQSPAQPVRGGVQPAFEIHERADGPEFTAEFFACYQFGRLGDENF
jgi:hypothetical protein